MRFMSVILALTLSMNVFAGSVSELEKSLDAYNYALTVEWDQKDQAFYNAKTQEFFASMTKLIKEQGLSQAEVLKLAESKMDKSAVEALKLKFTVLSKTSSAEDLAKAIQDSSKNLYARGASWNGEVIIPVAVGLVIAGVIGYAIWWNATHECVAWQNEYVCNTYNNCYGGGYDPYYGGGYYGGYYGSCYGTGYTTCGYEDVCTQYAKKD
ncbi:MAG: hypothetical protein ACJ76H_14265 [Bacteriovoracaceae bacterium]